MERPFGFRLLAVSAAILAVSQAHAISIVRVSSEAELAAAILQGNANAGSGTVYIELASNITLTQPLPPITFSVDIDGGGHTLTGVAGSRVLELGQDSSVPGAKLIRADISNLALEGGGLQAGAGQDGKGGAVLVNGLASVTAQNVTVSGSSATGGDSGAGLGANGLGGAFYVVSGGQLVIEGASRIEGNSVAGGSGPAGNGQAAGSGLFLEGSGELVINGPRTGKQLIISDDIADASSLNPASTDAWGLRIKGAGGDVVLTGNNQYAGETIINSATLVLEKAENIGSSGGAVVINNGGLALADQMTLGRDILVRSEGATLRVDSGVAQLTGDLAGASTIKKTGSGVLDLKTNSSFSGRWEIGEGMLSLDADSRLGGGSGLLIAGGGIRFDAAFNDLRAVVVNGWTNENGSVGGGAVFDANGHVIEIRNGIVGMGAGKGDVTFTGGGEFLLSGPSEWRNTIIESGKVTGAISEQGLSLAAGAIWNLGGGDRSLTELDGLGVVELGASTLTVKMAEADLRAPQGFAGVISGSGKLVLGRTDVDLSSDLFPMAGMGDYRSYGLTGINQHSGGVEVGAGIILVVDGQQNIGNGALTLAGGAVTVAGAVSSLDVKLSGVGGIATAAQDQLWNGVISGSGMLVKGGPGTLTLDNHNTYTGGTLVFGDDSFLALAREDALGSGTLTLTMGGGLKLLTDTENLQPILIGNGTGVIDTGGYDVKSSGSIIGTAIGSELAKSGSGRLLLTGNNFFSGGTSIGGGTLQIGNGGTTGTLGGSVQIASNAQLVINRSGIIAMNGSIDGNGRVVKEGTGTLELLGSNYNLFKGGLFINDGYVAFNSGNALGVSNITLNGGGLDFRGDLDRTVEINSGGGVMKVSSGTHYFFGDTEGVGGLLKNGVGTLVFNGLAEHAGGTWVQEGTLQIGEGLRGILTSDAVVDAGATLAFGRSDISQYDGVISGDGDVRKINGGQLVLTGDHLFNGDLHVDGGIVRIGNGGASGSLSGGADIAAGAALVFDRTGTVLQSGDIHGQGAWVQLGSGTQVFTGAADASVETVVSRGSLQVGNGGTSGSIAGDVLVEAGGLLNFQRSDDVTHSANIFGDGRLAQSGSGVLTLTGDASHEGGTFVTAGSLQVGDGGTSGSLSGSGGIKVSTGTELIFNRFDDVTQAGLIVGDGELVQRGAGRLTLTGDAAHSGGTRIEAGVLQVGNGGTSGSLLGNGLIDIAQHAQLVFNRSDDVINSSQMQGAGQLVQDGAGVLVLTGDALHTGGTVINHGSLQVGNGGTRGRLDSAVSMAAGTELVFNRSDLVEQSKAISGAGTLVQHGIGTLLLTETASHTGGTRVEGGVLQLGNGGSSGDIQGVVDLAERTLLVVNRNDTYHLAATLQGRGSLVQDGSGLTILDQVNQLSGMTWISNGRLGADADNKLGSGDIVLDGGAFSYQAAFNDLRNMRLTANGGGLDTNGFDVAYNGQIAGQGAFAKQGQGKLTLTGLLAAGSMAVHAGELQVGDQGQSGTLLGNASVDAGAILSFAHSDNTVFNGTLSGSGLLVQRGSGILQLGADNSLFQGSTVVEAGGLNLAQVLGGNLDIRTGGTLMGSGSLLGSLTLANGSYIKPGNSIGTLTVGGDLVFAPNSVYEVEVLGDGSGSSDRLIVGGQATLDGKVQVLAGAGEYKTDQRYTILKAGSLAGNFSSVSTDLVFLNAKVEKNGNDVELLLTRNGQSFTSVALTRNQQATADALQQLDPNHPLTIVVQSQNIEGARRAYDSFSGDGLIGLFGGQARLVQTFSDLINRRTSRMGNASRGTGAAALAPDLEQSWLELRQGQTPTAPAMAQKAADGNEGVDFERPGLRMENVWADARALQYDLDGDSTIGSPDTKLSGQILSFGVDGYWGDALAVGLGVATAQLDSKASARQTDGDIQSWLLGAYSRWDSDAGWHLKSSLALAQNDISSSRRVDQPRSRLSGSTSGSSISLAVEAGMGLQLWRLALRPFAGVSANRVTQDGYTESGGAAALAVSSSSITQGEARLGLDLSRAWLSDGHQWLQLGGTVALAQPWGDTSLGQTASFAGTGASFTVGSAADDSAAIQLRAGAAWFPVSRFSIWGGYEGRQSSVSSQHQGVLSLNFLW